MERKIIRRNIVFSLLLQITTMINGFIIPKVMLLAFGSETNGLLSSLGQFLNYIVLLEGGLGGVITSSLYKPLAEKNYEKISGIISAARWFLRKIAMIFLVYTLIVGLLYPRMVDTKYSAAYIFCLTFVLAINSFVFYFFSFSLRVLLIADRKAYIVDLTRSVAVVLNAVVIIVLVKYVRNILIVKLVSSILMLIQPVFWELYVRKCYPLNSEAQPDNKALSQRWDGFGQNMAYFVNNNTDIVLLTLFSTLTNVSIYSVYSMVVVAIGGFVSVLSGAIAPSFGNVLVTENKEHIAHFFDKYEFTVCFTSTVFFTCCMVLITPFISIYTKEIVDASYYQPVFGVLLAAARMIYYYRDSYVSAIYAAGHFRQTAKYAYAEAIINIVLSLLLVRQFGLIGVSFGTVISMLYRMIVQIFYLKKHILYRPIRKFVYHSLPFLLSVIVTLGICHSIIGMRMTSYFSWFLTGIHVFFICFAVTTGFCFLFFHWHKIRALRA